GGGVSAASAALTVDALQCHHLRQPAGAALAGAGGAGRQSSAGGGIILVGARPNESRAWDLPYSITSSASARRVGGKVTPSVLAVLRLMTISNFAACATGRSAGLSPLRMRLTSVAAWCHALTVPVP